MSNRALIGVAADIHHKKWSFGGRWEVSGMGDLEHTRLWRTVEMTREWLIKLHAQGCRKVVFNGDTLDEGEIIDPDVLSTWLNLMEFAKRELEMEMWMSVGNHEWSSKTRDSHVLSAFRPYATIVSEVKAFVSNGYGIVIMPFFYETKQALMQLEECIKYLNDFGIPVSKRFLFAHYPLKEACNADGRHFDCQLSAKDLQPDLWQWVLMGDIHLAQMIGRNVHYSGAPVPQTFSELRNRGNFELLDMETGGLGPVAVHDPFPIVEAQSEEQFQALNEAGALVRLVKPDSKVKIGKATQAAILNRGSMPDIIRAYSQKVCPPELSDEVYKELCTTVCGHVPAPPLQMQGR